MLRPAAEPASVVITGFCIVTDGMYVGVGSALLTVTAAANYGAMSV